MTQARRGALALVLFSTLISIGHAAGTSQAEKQARRSFQSAETHFKAGRFADALAEYQAGYDQAPLPGFLINIAQCHRRLGDLIKARATYQKFVMVAPDSPHVPEVKGLITELDKLIADLEPGKPAPAAAVPVAGAVPAEPALATEPTTGVRPLPAAPAPAAPRVPVLVDDGISATDTPEAAPPAHKSRWWLWTTIGVAVAGGAVTAYALTRSPDTTTVHEGTLGTLRR